MCGRSWWLRPCKVPGAACIALEPILPESLEQDGQHKKSAGRLSASKSTLTSIAFFASFAGRVASRGGGSQPLAVILLTSRTDTTRPMEEEPLVQKRIGGLLNYYHHEAA